MATNAAWGSATTNEGGSGPSRAPGLRGRALVLVVVASCAVLVELTRREATAAVRMSNALADLRQPPGVDIDARHWISDDLCSSVVVGTDFVSLPELVYTVVTPDQIDKASVIERWSKTEASKSARLWLVVVGSSGGTHAPLSGVTMCSVKDAKALILRTGVRLAPTTIAIASNGATAFVGLGYPFDAAVLKSLSNAHSGRGLTPHFPPRSFLPQFVTDLLGDLPPGTVSPILPRAGGTS